jgi:hypothetical protein
MFLPTACTPAIYLPATTPSLDAITGPLPPHPSSEADLAGSSFGALRGIFRATNGIRGSLPANNNWTTSAMGLILPRTVRAQATGIGFGPTQALACTSAMLDANHACSTFSSSGNCTCQPPGAAGANYSCKADVICPGPSTPAATQTSQNGGGGVSGDTVFYLVLLGVLVVGLTVVAVVAASNGQQQ